MRTEWREDLMIPENRKISFLRTVVEHAQKFAVTLLCIWIVYCVGTVSIEFLMLLFRLQHQQ